MEQTRLRAALGPHPGPSDKAKATVPTVLSAARAWGAPPRGTELEAQAASPPRARLGLPELEPVAAGPAFVWTF